MRKTAIITGSSSGIGKETAIIYAKKNYNLVLVARRTDKLNEIKQEIHNNNPVEITIISMDLATVDAAEKLFEIIKNKNLKIDVLINNAGFGLFGEFIDDDAKKQEQMLLLNIVTLTKLTHLFAKEMVKNNGGNIVNIASVAAFQPMPTFAVYAASKAYVLQFSEAIAYELKSKNVFVTAICPGATQSEFGKVAGFDEKDAFFKGVPSAKELASYIYQSMKKKKTTAIHGLKNKFLVFSNRFGSRKLATHIAYKVINK